MANYKFKIKHNGDIYWDMPRKMAFPVESYKYINTVWQPDYTWQRLAYLTYGDEESWYLITELNGIIDPYDVKNGDFLKILLPDYIKEVTLL
jgi:hypothetical protein